MTIEKQVKILKLASPLELALATPTLSYVEFLEDAQEAASISGAEDAILNSGKVSNKGLVQPTSVLKKDDWIINVVLPGKNTPPATPVDPEEEKAKKKKMVTIAVVIFVIIAVAVWYTSKKGK